MLLTVKEIVRETALGAGLTSDHWTRCLPQTSSTGKHLMCRVEDVARRPARERAQSSLSQVSNNSSVAVCHCRDVAHRHLSNT